MAGGRKLGHHSTTTKMSIRICLLSSPAPPPKLRKPVLAKEGESCSKVAARAVSGHCGDQCYYPFQNSGGEKSIHQRCFQLWKLKCLNRQRRGLVYTKKLVFKGNEGKKHIHQEFVGDLFTGYRCIDFGLLKVIPRMKLPDPNELEDYSCSFQGSFELMCTTVSFFFQHNAVTEINSLRKFQKNSAITVTWCNCHRV